MLPPLAVGTIGPSESADAVPWEKVLWKIQAYPDNHTDTSFLQALVVNADVPERRYWPVVLGSTAITQQLCIVIASVAIPLHLHSGRLQALHLSYACILLLAAGYFICALLGRQLLGGTLLRGVRQALLLTSGVYCLSPLLQTLTSTVSTDSVIALAVTMLFAHLYLHDYNFVNAVTEQLTGTLSLGAAVFSAVLIASRMPTHLDVFVQVLFALEVFLLSPYMRRHIRHTSLTAHLLTTAMMVTTASILLLPLSPPLTALFLLCIASLTFGLPGWLVSIHKFKAQINGPWDEAAPDLGRMQVHPEAIRRRQN